MFLLDLAAYYTHEDRCTTAYLKKNLEGVQFEEILLRIHIQLRWYLDSTEGSPESR